MCCRGIAGVCVPLLPWAVTMADAPSGIVTARPKTIHSPLLSFMPRRCVHDGGLMKPLFPHPTVRAPSLQAATAGVPVSDDEEGDEEGDDDM